MRRTISTHMLVFASGWIFVIPRTDKVAAKDLRASKKVESAPQDEGQPRGQDRGRHYVTFQQAHRKLLVSQP